jgi:dihydroorotase/N-acyl-D-amino-acid deacylase
MKRTLLSNGMLVDGLGSPRFRGDVLISDQVIVEVGSFEVPIECERIDCTGLTVAPGFIDGHNHLDIQVLEDRSERTLQGVTAEVVGNCGFSSYPTGTQGDSLREFANGLFCSEMDWGWPTAIAYIDAIKTSQTTTTVASLVGHGSLRIAVAGNCLGPLEATDVKKMVQLLDRFLNEGASGLSTGLMYVPGSSAPLDELEQLCRVVARQGKIYATHIRSYSSNLVEAVEEQIELARRTECRLQISHLQAVGADNWPQQETALEKIELARQEGIDVAFDCYPYVAGSTMLTMLMPQWSLDGGIKSLLTRLCAPSERRRISDEIKDSLPWRWSDIFISGVESERNKSAVQQNLSELSAIRNKHPVEIMIDLLIEEKGKVNVILFNQSEENLRQTIAHPLSLIVSDGFYVNGRPHPRLFGTFPKFLGTYCRDLKRVTLEDAIRKITSFPAERFGLRNTGRLQAGYTADITIFDADKIDSPATYEHPTLAPVGVKYVFRKGKPCLTP